MVGLGMQENKFVKREKMSRYTDIDWLVQEIEGWIETLAEIYGENDEYVTCLVDVLMQIDNAPITDVVEIKKEGEWEMFDLISSAYFGKGMYFKQDGGIVYSRYSCKYMSVDEAIREFVSLIDDSNLH